jgi:hypothetical protein
MSKISDIREVIDGKHVMGTQDGLRDYHAAREAVMSSCRKKDPYMKLAAIKTALKNYNVRVTLGPVADVMITANLDGSGLYTVV